MQEIKFNKNSWKLVVTDTAKTRLAPNFINLVQTAYAKTPEGSFVNTVKDVIPSNWIGIDWDKDPEADAVIFYRKNRPNEPWVGQKIQGIGHDAQRISIDKVIDKMKFYLKKDGWWVEASDALEHILYKDSSIPYIGSGLYASMIFPKTNLKMLNDRLKPGRYERTVSGHKIKETIFGKPKLK